MTPQALEKEKRQHFNLDGSLIGGVRPSVLPYGLHEGILHFWGRCFCHSSPDGDVHTGHTNVSISSRMSHQHVEKHTP
jgi:hypothetical protein